MTDRADLYKLLEFDKIRSCLKTFTLSDAAREKLDTVEFMREKDAVARSLGEVSEFRSILEFEDPFPLQSMEDIREDLDRLRSGNIVGVEALVRLLHNLQTVRLVSRYLQNRSDSYPSLWQHAQTLVPLKSIEEEILAKIDLKLLEVKDSASPPLALIRKSIAHSEQKARKAMDKLFKTYAGKGYLQEALVTIREGRFVLPLKLEHKAQVHGLVHDLSASGATLFIEPYEVVEINNQIKQLQGDEAQEIERLLAELAGLIREHLEHIDLNYEVLVLLDFIQAKARFAQNLKCTVPSLMDSSKVEIINGRHPLLLMREENTDSVIPLNLTLDNGVRTLVITGPNAGGKTVALKTVGLLALMLQSGIPIPTDADSSMPIFQDIFVDIGDFQSIEQDLSSFTSHLQKVGHILEHAGDRSLILVDEIGVGTDPDEGSAFAMAFLEELTKRSCTTIVTTHHGALKEFAFNTAGVENGSMEFDAETLKPTYRFRLGMPGSSYALEIAERVGISESVLKRARSQLGSEKGRLERLINDLEQKAQDSAKLAAELELENTRLKGLANLYSERSDALKRNEKELKSKALAEADTILKQANAAVERAVREIREYGASKESIGEARKKLANEKSKVAKAIKSLPTDVPEPANLSPPQVCIGETVYWKKQGTHGTIVSEMDGSGKVLIQVDNFKFRVPVSEIFESDTKPSEQTGSCVKIDIAQKNELLPEIDLRGQKIDEAITNADKFLDDAVLAGWSQVRLIHGKGLGILRKGIDEFLDKHPRVKAKKMGAWNEGDTGVTVVDLE
jgi:DNA mismatch repair protein MutS2